MLAWILAHQGVLVHALGALLLGVSEVLGLQKDPSKAKGLVDWVLKQLPKDPPASDSQKPAA